MVEVEFETRESTTANRLTQITFLVYKPSQPEQLPCLPAIEA